MDGSTTLDRGGQGVGRRMIPPMINDGEPGPTSPKQDQRHGFPRRLRFEGVVGGIERTSSETKWVVVENASRTMAFVAIIDRHMIKGLKLRERVLLEADVDGDAQLRNATVSHVWV